MPDGMIRVFESIFNIGYLTTVWILVALMARRRSAQNQARLGQAPMSTPVAGLQARWLIAFALLAAGDTFHVGARVLLAVLPGGATIFGLGEGGVLGFGMLATAYTMTVFYMVALDAFVVRDGSQGRRTPWYWCLQSLLLVRLIVMALPGNGWDGSEVGMGMTIARNLPLTIAGLWLAVDSFRAGSRGEKGWTAIGWSLVASYGFYLPVVLFARWVPALGLLMIPKTIAYVVLGLAAYRTWFVSAALDERARRAA